jgi:glycosyl transferase family 25
MHAQFERFGVPYTRVAAIDANLLPASEIDAFRRSVATAVRPHSWAAAQIGIFLSHKKVWAEIASDSDHFAAVFEDDVHLSSRIADLLKKDEWIGPTMDIVRLETTLQSMRLSKLPVSEIKGMKIFRLESSAWGAAGYLIRQDIAKWLFESPTHIWEPVDWLLFHPKSALAPVLRVFQLDPAPCVQDQYHPDYIRKRHFEKVTKDPTDWVSTINGASKQIVSPLARKLLGRRAVPFG